MRMFVLFAAMSLSACSAKEYNPVTAVPAQPGPPVITPVSLGELQGTEALVFPDIDVSTALSGAENYAAECLPDMRRISEPHGFVVQRVANEPFLRVMVASVSKSSALGLGGTGVTPELKEAVADSVQGRLRCAS